jgi:hypothetical protein
MIQAKTSLRQPNEAETYLATQKRAITILGFAARVRRKPIESGVRNGPDFFVVRPDLEPETSVLIFTDFTFFSWVFPQVAIDLAKHLTPCPNGSELKPRPLSNILRAHI